MGLELAKAYVSIRADESKLGGDMKKAQGSVTRSIAKLGAMVGPAIAAVVGGAGVAAMVSIARESIELAKRQAEAETRLAGVLRATGGAAGFTANELKKYASELQAASTTGDEEILESMAVLATFKNVSGDAFKRAQAAAIDLSATGFGSVSQATVQLAKALDDPKRGLSALRRVGVSFSKQQEEQIKNFMDMNDMASAQAIILEAVEGQVKGVAAALAATDLGKLQQADNTIGDIKEQLGNFLLPLMVKWKETQVQVFQGLLDGVKTLRAFVDNSGIIWDLFKVQASLAVVSVVDYFLNMQKTLPDITQSTVETLGARFLFWKDETRHLLTDLLGTFKTTFDAIKDLWANLLSGKGISASFQAAMDEIALSALVSVASSAERAAEFDKFMEQAAARNSKFDLSMQSELAKALEARRNQLALDLFKGIAKTEADAEAAAAAAGNTPVQMDTTGTEEAKKQEGIKAGSTGFAELGKQLQQKAIEQDDKNQKQMIGLMEAGNKIQQQQLEAQKQTAEAVKQPKLLGLASD